MVARELSAMGFYATFFLIDKISWSLSGILQAIKVLSFVLRQARAFPFSSLMRLFSGFLWAVITSVQPYLLKDIVNRLSRCSSVDVFDVLFLPVSLYILSYLIQSVGFQLHGYYVDAFMVPKMRKKIAQDAIKRLVQKPYRFFQDHFSGAISNRVSDLIRSVPDLLDMIFDKMYSHLLAFLIAIFFLWQVNIRFALLTVVWAALFFVGLYAFSHRFVRLSKKYAECVSDSVGHVVDFMSNVLSIHLFSSEVSERKILTRVFDRAQHAERRLSMAYLWMWVCFDYSFCLLQAVNFYLLCHGVSKAWLSVGDFALVLVLNGSILQILYRLSRDFSKFSKVYGQVSQALQVIGDDQVTTRIQSHLPCLRVKRGEIVFDQVQFHYATGVSLFNDKSVVIDAGQKVGLVGYSGAGKSTFVNLILGLYELQSGQILIDHQNIQMVTPGSLRRAISMIPQEPSLFNRSLLENIRYGRMDASDAEVVAAAKKAHAHEFIMRLADGYDTLVGERGIKISGGQRQRIAIARAILKDAPILILDEATSQLDSRTEKDIQDSLGGLMQNKTSIVIAHRLSTLLSMDRILVFNRGMIVGDGTHKCLLKENETYKALWDAQVGGFLPEDSSDHGH